MRFLIGLILIFLISPLTLWSAEGQDAAGSFERAEQVESTTAQDGYVAVSAAPTWTKPLLCPNGEQNCLFVKTTKYHWQVGDQITCGELMNETVIEQVEDRCDGGTCEKCYRVEHNEWIQDSSENQYAEFGLGAYSVTPGTSTRFLGTESSVDQTETNKTEYSFMPAAATVLVSGDAIQGHISTVSKDGIFVASNKNFEGTLADLESQDKSMRMGLRIFSAILMMLGWVLLVSQFTGPIAGLLNII
ncbi:MAG: hypothetical protein AAB802_05565, partial [Patescibacteria group bacterium]